MVTNVFDVTLTYYIITNLITPAPKMLFASCEVKSPRFSYKVIGLCLIYAAFFATFWFFFHDVTWLRSIGIIVGPIVIKLISKETYRNVLILYALLFLLATAVQLPTILLVNTLNLLVTIPLMYRDLIVISITWIVIILLCKNISLHRVYVFIKSKLKSQLIVFILPIIFPVALLHFFFDGTIEHILILATIFIVFALVIYKMISHVSSMQVKMEDINSLLLSTIYLINTSDDTTKVRKHLSETLEKLDFNSFDHALQVGQDQESLTAYINHQISRQRIQNEFVIEVHHFADNQKVPIPIMLHMLALLIYHASEKRVRKPIFVRVIVVGSTLEIKFRIPSERISPLEIDNMFVEGYAKKDGETEHGLTNLRKMVDSYNGRIIVDCRYDREYSSHYLELTIEVK